MSDADHSQQKQLIELIEAVIDGEATPEQKKTLADQIAGDPAVKELYLQHCSIHAALAWEHGVLDESMFPSDRDLQVGDLSTHPSFWIRIAKPIAAVAAIAIIAIIATLSWQFASLKLREQAWNSAEELGTLERNAGGHLIVYNTEIEIGVGDALRTGDYMLLEGLAGLHLKNNVELVIEAPSRFRIDSADLITLLDGKLTASVPPESIGFTIETPSAQIIDHGTEFGVDVSGNESSEVHVFEGEVEVKPHAEGDGPLRLLGQQATRVDTNSGIPSGIAMDPHRFLRSFDEPIIKYWQAIQSRNPIAHYRMKISDDGKTLIDESGNSRNGHINSPPSGYSPFAPGRIGASLRLDESDTYALVDECPTSSTQELSVIAWIYAKSRARGASIAKTKYNQDYAQFQIGLLGDHGGLEARIRDSNDNIVRISDSVPLPLNEWHQVVLVADKETFKLYRNGQLLSHSTHSGLDHMPHQLLSIGANINTRDSDHPNSPSHFWDGRIDELAIFDTALSPQEIQSLYAIANLR